MIKNSIPLLIIFCLIAAFLILWESPPESLLRATRTAAQATRYPEAIVTNSTTLKFNNSGQLDYRFTAVESRHFQVNPNRASAKDFTLTKAPSVQLYSDNGIPWIITAKHGRISQNSAIVDLLGNVKAVQETSPQQSTTFTTATLRIQPAIQFAQTDKAVIIRTPGNRTEAVGMKASLKQNTIQLLSNVRGIHELHH